MAIFKRLTKWSVLEKVCEVVFLKESILTNTHEIFFWFHWPKKYQKKDQTHCIYLVLFLVGTKLVYINVMSNRFFFFKKSYSYLSPIKEYISLIILRNLSAWTPRMKKRMRFQRWLLDIFNKTTYTLLQHYKDKDISSTNHFEVFFLKIKFLFAFFFFFFACLKPL